MKLAAVLLLLILPNPSLAQGLSYPDHLYPGVKPTPIVPGKTYNMYTEQGVGEWSYEQQRKLIKQRALSGDCPGCGIPPMSHIRYRAPELPTPDLRARAVYPGQYMPSASLQRSQLAQRIADNNAQTRNKYFAFFLVFALASGYGVFYLLRRIGERAEANPGPIEGLK